MFVIDSSGYSLLVMCLCRPYFWQMTRLGGIPVLMAVLRTPGVGSILILIERVVSCFAGLATARLNHTEIVASGVVEVLCTTLDTYCTPSSPGNEGGSTETVAC